MIPQPSLKSFKILYFEEISLLLRLYIFDIVILSMLMTNNAFAGWNNFKIMQTLGVCFTAKFSRLLAKLHVIHLHSWPLRSG